MEIALVQVLCRLLSAVGVLSLLPCHHKKRNAKNTVNRAVEISTAGNTDPEILVK